jgi:hypothetical protein
MGIGFEHRQGCLSARISKHLDELRKQYHH